MKKLTALILPMLLSACSWVVVVNEKQLEDGSYSVLVGGNSVSTLADLENKLKEYSANLCGEDNYTYEFSEEDVNQTFLAGGALINVTQPELDATITCEE